MAQKHTHTPTPSLCEMVSFTCFAEDVYTRLQLILNVHLLIAKHSLNQILSVVSKVYYCLYLQNAREIGLISGDRYFCRQCFSFRFVSFPIRIEQKSLFGFCVYFINIIY